jgi:serine/threonine protein kinase
MEAGERAGPPRQLGRYRVVTELARGSTSIVYLAALSGPQGFSKLVALKQLRQALAEDPAFVAMFLAEARLGARLSHPNVVSTLEIEDGEALPYIVMEYLDGQSMHDVVTAARVAFTPIPLPMHLAAIGGAIEGLAYAHAVTGYDGAPLNVVHRDVSPHNIFITFSGLPKVLDFGIAQTIDSPNLMPPSAGRASYMSPEQAAGKTVDARADLFALGVMIWEAATRKRFWSEAHGKAEILQALASRQLPATRINALANVPPDLRALALKATEPDRADRYSSASALLEDLHAVLRGMTPAAGGPRDLGRRIAPLFGQERARLRRAIDSHLELAATERVSSTSAPPEIGAKTPGPSEAAPVERSSFPPASAPIPLANVAVTSPPPSFAFSETQKDSWLAQHRGVAAGALALGVMAGLGIALLRGHDASAPAEPAPKAIAARTDVAASTTVVGVPAIERPAVDSRPEPGPAASLAVTQPMPSERPVSVEALPRVWKSPRPFEPRRSETARVADVGSAPPSALASPRPGVTEAVRVSDEHAVAPAPPLRPIDSVNPYGP